MSKKIIQLLAPRFYVYFVAMLAFSGVSALLDRMDVAIAELIVTGILYCIYYAAARQRKANTDSYLAQLAASLDRAGGESTINCPLPMVIFSPESDEIIWSNERFLQLTDRQEGIFDSRLSQLVPEFPTRWLLEGKSECPGEVTVGGRRYQVFGSVSRSDSGEVPALATTYWLDVTDYANTSDVYKATRLVVAVLLLDNYEDAIKIQEDVVRTAMLSDINQKFTEWVGDTGGLILRLDRDRYLFLFEEQYLGQYKSSKFDLLDKVHTVCTPNGIPTTLSIGVGTDGDTPAELFRFATLSADMALSRGGDQAVVKTRFGFEFYGGRSRETEKRTKVKSRVMASALGDLVTDASCVLVMGHRAADMDAVGAAVGVCAIARKRGVPAFLIRETVPTPADELYRRVTEMEYYRDRLIDAQEALLRADTNTLLVVVDTSRPEQVASPEVLTSCNKVAVIDHHRRAATYIEGAALNFHEPSASSASELVTELIGCLMEPSDLQTGEAEALMAGIMLDTKNFTMRTGGRTFEAAALLRRAGGDTNQVKKLFQTDLTDTIAKYRIIQNARIYRGDIAIAPVDRDVGRVTAAQAADELLNIAGINTSFVLYPAEDQVIVSARSINDTNVQVIVEALGGGGNGAAAGAQIPGRSVEEVTELLTAALDNYFREDEGPQPESV